MPADLPAVRRANTQFARTLPQLGHYSLTEKIPRSLRRMFITRAIEKGVDVKTIALWQGHKDGGKLILDTYSHVNPGAQQPHGGADDDRDAGQRGPDGHLAGEQEKGETSFMNGKVLIAFVMALPFSAPAAEQNLQADLALAAARLAEAAQPPPKPTAWRYIHNAEMPVDAVELAPEEQAEPGQFYQTRPLERPPGVPEDFVPARVFQWREDADMAHWRFSGWMKQECD
jgi:hypothetical protein